MQFVWGKEYLRVFAGKRKFCLCVCEGKITVFVCLFVWEKACVRIHIFIYVRTCVSVLVSVPVPMCVCAFPCCIYYAIIMYAYVR